MRYPVLAVLGLLSLHLSTATGAELQGSAAVLKKLANLSLAPAKNEEETPADKWLKKTDQYEANRLTMSPESAAMTWLSLVREMPERSDFYRNKRLGEWINLREQSGGGFGLALPPPASWKPLRKAIEAAKAKGDLTEPAATPLTILSHLLTEDDKALYADLITLLKSESSGEERHYRQAELLREMLGRLNDGTQLKTVYELLLQRQDLQELGEVQIPDLVTLIGAEQAKPLLRSMLMAPKFSFSIRNGRATEDLARSLALELADQLPKAPWTLCDSIKTVKLYEALTRRFPSDEHDGQDAYYLLGLIAENRTAEATAFLEKKVKLFSSDNAPHLPFEDMERNGYGRELYDFIHSALQKNPALPYWGNYIHLAVRQKEGEEMIRLLRSSMNRKELADKQRSEIRTYLTDALLAVDQVDEGVALLRKRIASASGTKDGDKQSPFALLKDYIQSKSGSKGEMLSSSEIVSALQKNTDETLGSDIRKLAELGHLLKKESWKQEALAQAEGLFSRNLTRRGAGGERDYSTESNLSTAVSLDIRFKRYAEAESKVVRILEATLKQSPTEESGYERSQQLQNSLIQLAEIYHLAGRHGDVLQLLDSAPWWGSRDLLDLERQSYGHGSVSLAFMAAKALAETGKADTAKSILLNYLQGNNGYDPAYELLLSVAGDGALSELDKLSTQDAFQERPLIWKGAICLKQGKLEEAERLVRLAISMDPSDGEEGKNDRMRVYAVLADILDKKGNTKEAGFFREVVKAIRLSEDADDWAAAGLDTQAVKRYEEALNHFSDAYCIQSRLARRMMELGRMEEAEAHYRKAFELMPDSFGRMESHCFGCEHAFEGERAQTIAEKVFSALAEKSGAKPQVYYLLGYLREEQERYQEAAGFYKKAFTLDPDYINALKRYRGLSSSIALPVAELDKATFELIRLDPGARHVSGNYDDVHDLKGLWQAVTKSQSIMPESPKSLYLLKASSAALDEKEKKTVASQDLYQHHYRRSYGRYSEARTPDSALKQVGLIRSVLSMLASD